MFCYTFLLDRLIKIFFFFYFRPFPSMHLQWRNLRLVKFFFSLLLNIKNLCLWWNKIGWMCEMAKITHDENNPAYRYHLLLMLWLKLTHQFCRTFDLFVVVVVFFVPIKNFSLRRRHHHYQWRATNIDLYSALIAIEKWGFFNMIHLWQGATLHNGHLREYVTLVPVAERLAVELRMWVKAGMKNKCG